MKLLYCSKCEFAIESPDEVVCRDCFLYVENKIAELETEIEKLKKELEREKLIERELREIAREKLPRKIRRKMPAIYISDPLLLTRLKIEARERNLKLSKYVEEKLKALYEERNEE